jgi:hypothetical protein
VLTLYVPRAIPLVLGVVGLLWGTPTAVAVLTDGRINPVFSALNLLIGVGLLYFAVRTSLIRVTMDEGQVVVRSRVRTQTAKWADVRGVALLQDGGIPRLRVVTTGEPIEVPAWSLRARYDDGEVEPAGVALERFGAEHGVRVKVRQLDGPVVE